jgi:DNA-binding MarR family transcriptional regulator
MIGLPLNSERQQALEIRLLTGIIIKTARQSMERHMAEKGISLSMLQFGILHVASLNTCTSAEMSKLMMLDPSTLVPAIDGLVEKGLIRKERDPYDRRRYLLQPTEEAHAFMSEMNVVTDDDPLLYAVQQLGTDESELLVSLLRKVVESLPEGETIVADIQTRIDQLSKPRII